MSVPDWEDPRRVLGRYGLAPKKKFSQSFLVSRHAVEALFDKELKDTFKSAKHHISE